MHNNIEMQMKNKKDVKQICFEEIDPILFIISMSVHGVYMFKSISQQFFANLVQYNI